MSKLLTVFGATGIQGGSVVNALLSHPTLSKEYKIRAVTRDPSKANAQALISRGVEAVKGDVDDHESLEKAVSGSYAVFAVTNYWEKKSKEAETTQGKAIADACKAAGVHHLVWSTLYNVTKLSGGVLKHVLHFDSKADVAEYIERTKGDMVATYFMPGIYMSNFKGMIRPGTDGVPTLSLPWDADKTQVPLLDTASDSGKFVAGILAADPQKVNGRYVHAVSQWATPREIVDTLSSTIGTKVNFASVPAEVFQSFLPEQIAVELTENMVLIRDYSYFGVGQEKEQAKHNELLGEMTPTTWEEFVKANGPWKWSK